MPATPDSSRRVVWIRLGLLAVLFICGSGAWYVSLASGAFGLIWIVVAGAMACGVGGLAAPVTPWHGSKRWRVSPATWERARKRRQWLRVVAVAGIVCALIGLMGGIDAMLEREARPSRVMSGPGRTALLLLYCSTVMLDVGPWLAATAAWVFVLAAPSIVVDLLCGFAQRGSWRRDAHPRCRRCGYDLRVVREPRCPECGLDFDPADPRTVGRDRAGLSTAAAIAALVIPQSIYLFIVMVVGVYLGSWFVPFMALLGYGLAVGVVAASRAATALSWALGSSFLVVAGVWMHSERVLAGVRADLAPGMTRKAALAVLDDWSVERRWGLTVERYPRTPSGLEQIQVTASPGRWFHDNCFVVLEFDGDACTNVSLSHQD